MGGHGKIMENHHYELVVVGGGSGGFAAALAAGRAGVRTLVIERGSMLGGTATQGGVNCWEMGVGGTGIPFEVYRRLKQEHPEAVGIYSYGRHFSWQDRHYWPDYAMVNFPGGELLIDPERRYLDTLRRHPGPGQVRNEAFCRKHWHGVPFLPQPMANVQRRMLEETGCVTVRLDAAFVAVETSPGSVRSISLDDGTSVEADYWIDGTGGIFCHACGCDTWRGVDPRARFNEPGAPEHASDAVNAVTLMYRVAPAPVDLIEPLPHDIPERCWWANGFPPMSCVQYPDLSRNCNMLPTMEGRERIRLGYLHAYDECQRRVKAHWHFIQANWSEFRRFRLSWIAPMLGIRESRRVVCEYMLTENDILRGLSGQDDPDLIAIADHALDRHGEGGGCPELDEPYGVPYRCLVPRGWNNLLVASRGAGFSSIAASSCRLSRTMMQLGQAAGNAVAIARDRGCRLPAVPPDDLRQALHDQHVQLAFPLTSDLQAYLACEAEFQPA